MHSKALFIHVVLVLSIFIGFLGQTCAESPFLTKGQSDLVESEITHQARQEKIAKFNEKKEHKEPLKRVKHWLKSALETKSDKEREQLIRSTLYWLWYPQKEGGFRYATWKFNGKIDTRVIKLKKDGEVHDYELFADDVGSFRVRLPRKRGILQDNLPIYLHELKLIYKPFGSFKALEESNSAGQETELKAGDSLDWVSLTRPADNLRLNLRLSTDLYTGKLKAWKSSAKIVVEMRMGEYRTNRDSPFKAIEDSLKLYLRHRDREELEKAYDQLLTRKFLFDERIVDHRKD